ncbi:MAG: DNA polymerase IV [Gemmatimonadales bacterium]|nr:DNA polymerase IV [Gemmatimonadales bacterium]MDZ4388744.1 DNA polymerase IV [Gemmatimonadales bacterium]
MSVRILHVDLDAFFVEVCRRHDPALRDVERLIVGGKRTGRGVVQSASYGARTFGVRSGMPIAEAARRCPDATFVQGEFAWYREASRAVRKILQSHAPLVVMAGLDEGYLDFSGTDLLHPASLLAVATAIRNDVHARTGLDCSIGIGPNRMLAKIASDYAKPRGICEVRSGWERGFMAGLPLKALPGIGPKTAARLAARGLVQVAEVQAMSIDALAALIGREEALLLARRAEGRGGATLRPGGAPKSISRETTFNRDLTSLAALDRVLVQLSARMAGQLRDEGLSAGAIVLKLRHADFRTITRRVTLPRPSALDGELLETARRLLRPALVEARRAGQAIRLLGVAATQLAPTEAPDLFESPERGRARGVSQAVDAVRAKFGFGSMQTGSLVKSPRSAPPGPGTVKGEK